MIVRKSCIACQSVWPATTTIEAYRNHQRANRLHPDRKCFALPPKKV